MKKNLIVVCLISLSIVSCDPGVQIKKRVVNKQEIQDSRVPAREVPEVQKQAAPTDIEALIAQGSQSYSNHEYEKAISYFLMVYEIDKTSLITLISLGNLYFDTGKYKDAISFYTKALELDPNNLNVRCDMGTCYFKDGMVEKAIEVNKKNIELDFNHIQSHHNLAIFYEQVGDMKKAEEEMRIYNKITGKTQQ